MSKYDLVVIGSGAGASAGTMKASELGKSVAVIERGPIGGTCVNVGCVPSKFFLAAGEIIHQSVAPGFAGISLNGGLELDFKRLAQEKNDLVTGLRTTKYEGALENLDKVSVIRGEARFVSPNEVDVAGESISGTNFLIAVGSSPVVPQIPGLAETGYLTNVEALDLDHIPSSVVVLGAGALGLEFAQMWRRFGSRVTVIQRRPKLLPEMEPEVGRALKIYLEAEGIRFLLGADVSKVESVNGRRLVTVRTADGAEESIETDEILAATGRRPNTSALGLENAGVAVKDDGSIAVDDTFKTSEDHIYAAGDVLGEPMLETLAAREGALGVENMLTGARRTINFQAVPATIFTDPQVATVGLTDEQANGSGFVCSCRTLPIEVVPKAQIIRDNRGLIKMVTEAGTGRILGVSIVARGAGDLIHEAVLAVKYGLTIDDIIDTIHVFPTMSEAMKLVAQSFRRNVASLPCCTE